MNEQELIQLQVTMGLIFRQIDVLLLDEYIDRLDRSLNIAPFLDPTLWMQKGEDGRRALRIAKAFRTCRDTIAKEFVTEGETN